MIKIGFQVVIKKKKEHSQVFCEYIDVPDDKIIAQKVLVLVRMYKRMLNGGILYEIKNGKPKQHLIKSDHRIESLNYKLK